MYQIPALLGLKRHSYPLVPMFFPILWHISAREEFQYFDFNWKELCGIMAILVAESGGNKGQNNPALFNNNEDLFDGNKAMTIKDMSCVEIG